MIYTWISLLFSRHVVSFIQGRVWARVQLSRREFGFAFWVEPYIVEVSITKETSTTGNNGPQAFPAAFLRPCDTNATLGVLLRGLALDFCGRSHG